MTEPWDWKEVKTTLTLDPAIPGTDYCLFYDLMDAELYNADLFTRGRIAWLMMHDQ